MDVLLRPHRSSIWLCQVFSGFGMLRRAGRVQVRLEPIRPFTGCQHTMRAVVEADTKVVYDVGDAARNEAEDEDWADLYFKRSYDPSMHGSNPKVVPLGLNYGVFAKGDWRWRRAWWGARDHGRPDADLAADLVQHLAPVSLFGRPNFSPATADVARFEAAPVASRDPRVLMLTRTYDPDLARPSRQAECRELTELRVGLVRALRSAFGSRFVGGLAASPDAVRDHPDLVADPALTRKSAYVRQMRSADVCVTSAGVWRSNGWRLAEYTAASKAIVSEHLAFEVPGFTSPANHLAFATPDECVEHVTRLLDAREQRLAMMQANHRFYEEHVRPDALVGRSLDIVASYRTQR